jgi:predicted methyltransferase
MLTSLLRVVLCCFLVLFAAFASAEEKVSQADLLMNLLSLEGGMTVAEVGAGEGELTIAIAQKLGPRSLVYSTELKTELPDLRRAIRKAGLRNVLITEAGVRDTHLPPSCCEAIFMRRVYHHFRDPRAENRSLFRNLRPGGRLAIIDMEPQKDWDPPEGVRNRGGHGVARDEVIAEVTAAGFALEMEVSDWPEDLYALVFRKPVKSRR